MYWYITEGNWTKFRGDVKAQWGKLTDDQIDGLAGKRGDLVGKLQQAYGITKEDAELQIKEFEARSNA
jgi:uncharacterized protein YjbJ (UPF0337 family)